MLQEIDQLPRWRYGLDVSLAGVLNEGGPHIGARDTTSVVVPGNGNGNGNGNGQLILIVIKSDPKLDESMYQKKSAGRLVCWRCNPPNNCANNPHLMQCTTSLSVKLENDYIVVMAGNRAVKAEDEWDTSYLQDYSDENDVGVGAGDGTSYAFRNVIQGNYDTFEVLEEFKTKDVKKVKLVKAGELWDKPGVIFSDWGASEVGEPPAPHGSVKVLLWDPHHADYKALDSVSDQKQLKQWRPLAGDTDYEAFDMGAKIMKLNINLGELGEFEEVQQLGDIVKSRYEPVEQIPLFATHADKVAQAEEFCAANILDPYVSNPYVNTDRASSVFKSVVVEGRNFLVEGQGVGKVVTNA
ncbi:hypothetical protein T484DRAFT_2021845, partial [Baffinella frigidus]